jgi:hypothetical protein
MTTSKFAFARSIDPVTAAAAIAPLFFGCPLPFLAIGVLNVYRGDKNEFFSTQNAMLGLAFFGSATHNLSVLAISLAIFIYLSCKADPEAANELFTSFVSSAQPIVKGKFDSSIEFTKAQYAETMSKVKDLIAPNEVTSDVDPITFNLTPLQHSTVDGAVDSLTPSVEPANAAKTADKKTEISTTGTASKPQFQDKSKAKR